MLELQLLELQMLEFQLLEWQLLELQLLAVNRRIDLTKLIKKLQLIEQNSQLATTVVFITSRTVEIRTVEYACWFPLLLKYLTFLMERCPWLLGG